MKPRIIHSFLDKYRDASLPREDIAHNVLSELGVPSTKVKEVYSLIIEGAKSLKILQNIKGKDYVIISDLDSVAPTDESNPEDTLEAIEQKSTNSIESEYKALEPNLTAQNKRVFITHGKDTTFIEPIKKLLKFGELEAIVSVEKESVSQPVPEKVMNDMRLCGTAIIHVDAESRLVDKQANEHVVLNPNVLIEIGAAMALYGQRFIILVKDGIELPSNLQGLYTVRYSGDRLDWTTTIKLLEAINEMKGHRTPER